MKKLTITEEIAIALGQLALESQHEEIYDAEHERKLEETYGVELELALCSSCDVDPHEAYDEAWDSEDTDVDEYGVVSLPALLERHMLYDTHNRDAESVVTYTHTVEVSPGVYVTDEYTREEYVELSDEDIDHRVNTDKLRLRGDEPKVKNTWDMRKQAERWHKSIDQDEVKRTIMEGTHSHGMFKYLTPKSFSSYDDAINYLLELIAEDIRFNKEPGECDISYNTVMDGDYVFTEEPEMPIVKGYIYALDKTYWKKVNGKWESRGYFKSTDDEIEIPLTAFNDPDHLADELAMHDIVLNDDHIRIKFYGGHLRHCVKPFTYGPRTQIDRKASKDPNRTTIKSVRKKEYRIFEKFYDSEEILLARPDELHNENYDLFKTVDDAFNRGISYGYQHEFRTDDTPFMITSSIDENGNRKDSGYESDSEEMNETCSTIVPVPGTYDEDGRVLAAHSEKLVFHNKKTVARNVVGQRQHDTSMRHWWYSTIAGLDEIREREMEEERLDRITLNEKKRVSAHNGTKKHKELSETMTMYVDLINQYPEKAMDPANINNNCLKKLMRLIWNKESGITLESKPYYFKLKDEYNKRNLSKVQYNIACG